MESFLGRFKVEVICAGKYKTIETAQVCIFEYIEIFYNRLRPHLANSYMSPHSCE